MSRYRIVLAPGLVIALLMMVLPDSVSARPSALGIMKKVQARNVGNSSEANVEMILINQSGSNRVRRMKVLSKENDQSTSRVIYFEAPTEVRGTAFLIREYKQIGRENDQWLYLPALRKTKRISTQEKAGSFMGSDLSYADIGRDSLDETHYKLLKEGRVDGRPVWIIEARPETEAVALKKGYNKSLILVRQDNYVIVRSVKWMLDGNLIRYLDVKKLEEIDGIWAPTEMRIWTTKNRKIIHQTILHTSGIRFNREISDDLFKVRQLEKGY